MWAEFEPASSPTTSSGFALDRDTDHCHPAKMSRISTQKKEGKMRIRAFPVSGENNNNNKNASLWGISDESDRLMAEV